MTITRTFGNILTSTYTALAIVEIVHFRDMIFDIDERVAVYLDTANAICDLGSFNIGKFPDLNGDESEVEESLALNKAESESNKVGLRILERKNNTGDWTEIAEFILLNYGRKNYLDLRGRLGYPSKLMERNDALAVQLVDYGDGLLWDTDFIKVNFAATVEIAKKNDVEALNARIAALELALEGKLINLPPNSLLGRNASTGTVEVIAQSNFPKVTSGVIVAPLPASTHGSIALGGVKNGYAGINFPDAFGSPVLMQGAAASYINGVWSGTSVNGWLSLYNEGEFSVYNSRVNSEGTFLALSKALGSLPGYPSNRYPTLKTNFTALYFAIDGRYSAVIEANGIYSAVSDENRKENKDEVDYGDVLNKLENISIYTYNFIGEDNRIRRMSCFAQDFYAAYGLGGNEEIDSDDSPTRPSKMLSPSDAIGVCMAAIKALNKKMESFVKYIP